MRFDWLAKPSPKGMVRALEVLFALGILDRDAKLTSPLGYQLAEFPLVSIVIFYHPVLCTIGWITLIANNMENAGSMVVPTPQSKFSERATFTSMHHKFGDGLWVV